MSVLYKNARNVRFALFRKNSTEMLRNHSNKNNFIKRQSILFLSTLIVSFHFLILVLFPETIPITLKTKYSNQHLCNNHHDSLWSSKQIILEFCGPLWSTYVFKSWMLIIAYCMVSVRSFFAGLLISFELWYICYSEILCLEGDLALYFYT